MYVWFLHAESGVVGASANGPVLLMQSFMDRLFALSKTPETNTTELFYLLLK